MTWKGVGIVYVVLAVLAAVVLLFEGPEPSSAPSADPAPPAQSLLGIDAAAVAAVSFSRDGAVVRAARENQRWRAVEPRGAEVPSDLIEATVATLTTGQAAEVLANGPEDGLEAYGLDAPAATLEVTLADTPDRPISIAIGGRNPTRTAVYARRGDRQTIYLVGMNLRYFIDLIFDAAKGKG